MVGRRDSPAAPRISTPDLPDELDDLEALAPRDDLLGVRIAGLSGAVTAPHARIAESRIEPAGVDALDVTGATLTDVAIADLRAPSLLARDGAWRTVDISGGRIGTLDALRATWQGVVLRGIRIDYLSLASARLDDVLFVDCTIGALDVPEARLARVRFDGCRADEVDTRGLRAADLDLRGLEALSFTDARALQGATLDARQAETHAAAFADALGIRVAR